MLRVGLGYDSHTFRPPGPLTLGGIRIPFDNHLHGHSDGDAVCHALTDAILGAAGLGDIGDMFSDRDPNNAGRDSVGMLAAAVERVSKSGYHVSQADVTIVAESPRLTDYKDAMKRRLAPVLGIDVALLSVKAKTNEGLGWIGRGEGIACVAVATLAPA
ncbi:MAG TPA: 2-C-methyl-D-erythritol 2,4-cyclodiphosphate synthase [Gemmatimonadaceae bacterium]|jgi:2-C-methyl-D-erythritol 2,4-cyclodiphosphate synthase